MYVPNQSCHEDRVSHSQNQERGSRQEYLQIPSSSVAQVIPEQIQFPKRLNDQDNEGWFYKIVSPPWDRRIVSLKMPQDEQ